MELTVKYEQILGRRGALLEQMEERRLQLRGQRTLNREKSQAAHNRNQSILQELASMEQRVREAQVPSSEMLSLESRYWACVEESVPAWEYFLLGKGLQHTPDVQPSVAVKHKAKRTKDTGLPPLPVRQTSSSKQK